MKKQNVDSEILSSSILTINYLLRLVISSQGEKKYKK